MCAILLGLVSLCQDSSKSAEAVRDLASPDLVVRNRAYVLAMAQLESVDGQRRLKPVILLRGKHMLRNRRITEIEAVLYWTADRSSEEFLLACLLDKLNDSEALDVLIQYVSLRSPEGPISGEDAWSIKATFPVTGFLVEKRRLVIPPVIKGLSNLESDGRRRRNLCWVLKEIAGRRGAVDLIGSHSRTLSGKPRQNLEACLPYFEGEIEISPRRPFPLDYNIK
jgi:hypothetical protein